MTLSAEIISSGELKIVELYIGIRNDTNDDDDTRPKVPGNWDAIQ